MDLQHPGWDVSGGNFHDTHSQPTFALKTTLRIQSIWKNARGKEGTKKNPRRRLFASCIDRKSGIPTGARAQSGTGRETGARLRRRNAGNPGQAEPRRRDCTELSGARPAQASPSEVCPSLSTAPRGDDRRTGSIFFITDDLQTFNTSCLTTFFSPPSFFLLDLFQMRFFAVTRKKSFTKTVQTMRFLSS